MNEGAMKGILVTTSDFGPDAHSFAKGKPLTLISGAELLYLFQKHGYEAKIDIRAAKELVVKNNRYN
jgi:restriction system protein